MRLFARPMSLKEANHAVEAWHRHHKPVRFHLFSIGVMDEDCKLHGVAIVMRPVNPAHAEWPIAEVCRIATDGTKNACSFLLARSARAAFEMGYLMIQTFTMPQEGGASLRAAGWQFWGEHEGAPWNHAKRKRNDSHPIGKKWKWVRVEPEFKRKIDRELAA